MSQEIHLWVGRPNSPSELAVLLSRLEKSFPATKGRTQVVFENETLTIADLAAGFGSDESLLSQVSERAASLGWMDASAMIGVTAGVSVSSPNIPEGLTYLGAFNSVEE
jgi:hypothetical protein